MIDNGFFIIMNLALLWFNWTREGTVYNWFCMALNVFCIAFHAWMIRWRRRLRLKQLFDKVARSIDE